MRLIDADSIRFKPYYDEYVDYDGYINDLKTWQLDDILSDRVDNTPTVKAIPIEWILKRAKLCTADYANCLYYLVEAWRTEQKYMVNGQWKFPKDGEKENQSLE